MKALVSLTLLLFEILLTTASVERSPESNKIESDVYEIQGPGDQKTAFLAPKHQTSTLREIVYYHIVEKPYGDNAEHKPEPARIEMDDSLRPFTNGHGYQFADNDLHETDKHDSSDYDAEGEDLTGEEDEPAEEVVPETSTAENKPVPESTTTTEVTTDASVTDKAKLKHRQFLFDRLKERYLATLKRQTTTEKPTVVNSTEEAKITTETSTLANTTEVETSTADAVTSSTPLARRRRSVNYDDIPIAPTLPAIDYSLYPGLRVFREEDSDTSSQDETEKSMRHRINDIFATMKPNKNKNNDDDYGIIHEPDNKPKGFKENTNDDEPYDPSNTKTYGMNLSDNHGYVWNNMFRPINYYVGESVALGDNEDQVTTVKPFNEEVVTQAPTTTAAPATTSTPTTINPEDLDDIFVDVKKKKDNRNPTTEKPDNTENIEPIKDENVDKIPMKTEENESISDNVASRSLKKPNKSPRQVKQRKPSKEPSDLYEQLMNSDKFWKWLAKWSANYMEVLSEHFEDMIKEEVAKEIEKYKIFINEIQLDKTNDVTKSNNTEIDKNTVPDTKNSTITTDDKQISLTNTTDLKGNVTSNKDDLTEQRDKDEKNNPSGKKTITRNEENVNNVNATVVYGSSTGNDEVTNIFIFTGTESEKVIAGIKPFMHNPDRIISNTDNEDHSEKQESKEKNTTQTTESVLPNKEPATTDKPINTSTISTITTTEALINSTTLPPVTTVPSTSTKAPIKSTLAPSTTVSVFATEEPINSTISTSTIATLSTVVNTETTAQSSVSTTEASMNSTATLTVTTLSAAFTTETPVNSTTLSSTVGTSTDSIDSPES